MKLPRPIIPVLLSVLSFSHAAGAYTMPEIPAPDRAWWRPPAKSAKSPLPMLPVTPVDATGVGSVVTREGRIARLDVSFNDQPGPVGAIADCRAEIASGEGRGFVLLMGSEPALREGDPRAEPLFFRQTAACLSARRAYLNGLPVSVSGRIERMGSGDDLAEIRAASFATLPAETVESVAEAASICINGSCQAQGLVTKVAYELRDTGPLCSADLRIPAADGSAQEASLKVAFPKYFEEYRWLSDFQNRQLLHGKFQACQLLEAAAGTDKTVRVEGRGQAAAVGVSSITLEETPPPALQSLF